MGKEREAPSSRQDEGADTAGVQKREQKKKTRPAHPCPCPHDPAPFSRSARDRERGNLLLVIENAARRALGDAASLPILPLCALCATSSPLSAAALACACSPSRRALARRTHEPRRLDQRV